MQKLLTTLFTVLTIITLIKPALAGETIQLQLGQDYIITTEKKVGSSFVKDEKILTLAPFFTIFNEKNVLILHPKTLGKTEFRIFCEEKEYIFDTEVKSKIENEQFPIKKDIFEIHLLDIPPSLNDLKNYDKTNPSGGK